VLDIFFWIESLRFDAVFIVVMGNSMDEKIDYNITAASPTEDQVGTVKSVEIEVFQTGADGIDFRTVGWIRGKYHSTSISL
jgi:hypothetical protein